jgi:hypothetical protein
MQTYDGVEVWLHSFLTLSLDGGELLASSPSFILKKRTPVPMERGLGGPQVDFNVVGNRKILTCQEPNHGLPTHTFLTELTELFKLQNSDVYDL